MHPDIKTQTQAFPLSVPINLTIAAAALLVVSLASAQSVLPPQSPAPSSQTHRSLKRKPSPQQIVQSPAPPPMPHWPVNDTPNPPSVVWDASGLRINATNSSLQQILNEVSTDTGTKVVGNVPDQRVFGSYGPGRASDVLLQLLQGSGYNVLLAGNLGHGAPSQIVLTPRQGGSSNAPSGMNPQQPQPQQQNQDDTEAVDQQEPPEQPEETVPAIPPTPQQPSQGQPGMPPNGPMRTPQEIMQEMQQRQLLQQQQMQQQLQQQQQQGNPATPPENPE